MLRLDRHVPSPGVPEFNKRFPRLLGVVEVTFMVLVGRLWQLQIVRGARYFKTSTNNFIKKQWIEADRGKIVDRNGNVLVDNRPSWSVYVTPRYLTEDSRELLIHLMGLPRTQAEALREKIAQGGKGAEKFR